MIIVNSGIINPVDLNDTLKVRYFPSLVALSNRTLLLTCRTGSEKISDDGIIQMFRSSDNGAMWKGPEIPFELITVDGVHGSYHLCYVTELEPGHLLAACMWIDRESYPNKPLFNPDTEGSLPKAILLSDSYDFGNTWTPLRKVEFSDEIGPPGLTNPVIKLTDGTLAMSIETNKAYTDSTKWDQKAIIFFSSDAGKTWGNPVTSAYDPKGRIFNWDQRIGVAHNGTIAAFLWTYDSQTAKYLNVHRRLSLDGGKSFSPPEDLGFADQPGHPAVLDDGRVLLAWVDRFGSNSIRARIAPEIDKPFDPETEIEIHNQNILHSKTAQSDTTGELLEDICCWTYGLPYAEVLPDGDVMVVYYAGDSNTMNIHFSRIYVNI